MLNWVEVAEVGLKWVGFVVLEAFVVEVVYLDASVEVLYKVKVLDLVVEVVPDLVVDLDLITVEPGSSKMIDSQPEIESSEALDSSEDLESFQVLDSLEVFDSSVVLDSFDSSLVVDSFEDLDSFEVLDSLVEVDS